MARIPVMSNKECNKYFRGRVRENEMCTNSFQGGVGACEVSDCGENPERLEGFICCAYDLKGFGCERMLMHNSPKCIVQIF